MQGLAIDTCKSLALGLLWPALLHSVWFALVAASLAALVMQASTRLSHATRYGILLTAILLLIPGTIAATFLMWAVAGRPHGNDGPTSVISIGLVGENTAPESRAAGATPSQVPVRSKHVDEASGDLDSRVFLDSRRNEPPSQALDRGGLAARRGGGRGAAGGKRCRASPHDARGRSGAGGSSGERKRPGEAAADEEASGGPCAPVDQRTVSLRIVSAGDPASGLLARRWPSGSTGLDPGT